MKKYKDMVNEAAGNILDGVESDLFGALSKLRAVSTATAVDPDADKDVKRDIKKLVKQAESLFDAWDDLVYKLRT